MKKQLPLLFVTIFGGLFTAVNPLPAQIWTPTSAPTNAWASVAGSADGSKLVAAVNGGGIYTSTNSGATWTLTSALGWPRWTCVASSADGTILAAVSGEAQGNVYISTNSGASWNNRNEGMVFPSLPMFDSPYGSAVCLSADGTKLVVAENIYDWVIDNFDYGLIYTSTNSGTTWNAGYESEPSDYWSSVACSADGTKSVAAVYGGRIYTSQTTPAPVLNIAPSNNKLAFSWIVTSTNFVLQQNSDLCMANWIDVTNASVLNLTNLQNQVALPLPAGNAFYRLKTP
jgi:photosystem II stability/assembly factor-like uncharacterized protein